MYIRAYIIYIYYNNNFSIVYAYVSACRLHRLNTSIVCLDFWLPLGFVFERISQIILIRKSTFSPANSAGICRPRVCRQTDNFTVVVALYLAAHLFDFRSSDRRPRLIRYAGCETTPLRSISTSARMDLKKNFKSLNIGSITISKNLWRPTPNTHYTQYHVPKRMVRYILPARCHKTSTTATSLFLPPKP